MENIEVKKATFEDKQDALALLDEFRSHVIAVIDGTDTKSNTARNNGGQLFQSLTVDKNSAIFLAKVQQLPVGIVTIHKVAMLRKGIYRGEIEEMFVKSEFQGKGVAQKLMQAAIEWATQESIATIMLESASELVRAHSFYKKFGFREYGKAFKLDLLGKQ